MRDEREYPMRKDQMFEDQRMRFKTDSSAIGSSSVAVNLCLWVDHYENTPIQIYRKFHPQKQNFQINKKIIFFIFLLKT